MKAIVVRQIDKLLHRVEQIVENTKLNIEEKTAIYEEAISAIEVIALEDGDKLEMEKCLSESRKFFGQGLYRQAIELIRKKCQELICYEVLFLPYKASMWDSFDTVYRAALREKNWNVKVMPIPFYYINADREVLSEEYEGELFPKDISITKYTEYDIAYEQPDIIFIHNPYDECNAVTEVYPEYFSSNLKKYCEHIVYIPYFVVDKIMSDGQCTIPGPQNAWRVIAQDERCRKQYIEVGAIEEKKVLALGSPKTDKVLDTINHIDVPEEWRRIIEDKKVFFLNTHLSNVMSDIHLFVNKLRYIMEVFDKEKEAVLLWRPHPLSIQTAKAINPACLEEYLAIIEEFKSGDNRIYDDTADINRTIAISDAYIGESYSSVSKLIESSDRPIYLIDSFETEENASYVLRSQSGECIGNTLYCSNMMNDMFFNVDLESKKIEVWRDNSNTLKCQKYNFMNSLVIDNHICFIPGGCNDYIYMYNVVDKRIQRILIENGDCGNYEPVMVGETLFLLPIYYAEHIPCVNVQTANVEYVQFKSMERFASYRGKRERLFFKAVLHDSKIYRVCKADALIQEISLDGGVEYIEISGVEGALRSIVHTPNGFWILPQNQSCVFLWDEKKNCILRKIEFGKSVSISSMEYWEIISYQGHLVLTGMEYPLIVLINEQTEEVKVFDCNDIKGFKMCPQVGRVVFAVTRLSQEGDLVLVPNAANGIVILKKDFSLEYISTEINEESFFVGQQTVNQSVSSLKYFVSRVVKTDLLTVTKSKEKPNGEIIWNTISSSWLEEVENEVDK